MAGSTLAAARDLVGRVVEQARLLVDRDKWSLGSNWKERLSAVSWPRAGAIGALTALIAGSAVWLLQPEGIRAHPPRLPTEEEWRANQSAAKAMEADLSPALAAANRSVSPGAAQ